MSTVELESVASECSQLSSLSCSIEDQQIDANTKKKRGRKRKVELKNEASFSYTCHLKENHHEQIFGVASNPFVKTGELVFCTVAGNRCTIYETIPESSIPQLRRCISDQNNDESFYCCVWLYDNQMKKHLVAVGGKNGVIRVFDAAAGSQHCALVGHGNSVNELSTHPTDFNLLLSASKDHTLRLWNVRHQLCIAIFGGADGHRDEVLSVDFDINGEKVVSAGIDHTVRIWHILQNPTLDSAIKMSYETHSSKFPFETIKIQEADFCTKDLHTNYVDCVRFYADFIFSKACENSICLWKPGDLNTLEFAQEETNVVKMRDYRVPNCTYWFMKFAVDYQFRWLAAGNQAGRIYMWNLTSSLLPTKPTILSHPKCSSTIRQLAFSPDGNALIAVCDDGTIWRWDNNNSKS